MGRLSKAISLGKGQISPGGITDVTAFSKIKVVTARVKTSSEKTVAKTRVRLTFPWGEEVVGTLVKPAVWYLGVL